MSWNSTHHGDFVAYYRVEGADRRASGETILQQKDTVRRYLGGGSWNIIGEFTEFEGSRKAFRPALDEAIEMCLARKATLVIAEMGRLYRNAFFISRLLQSKVKFVACDNQHANEASIHVIAAIVEHDSEYFSKRTVEALDVARKNGRKLGSPSPEIGAKAAGEAVSEDAEIFARRVWPMIIRARREGCDTFRSVAQWLTEMGVPTARGGEWHPTTVQLIERRMKKNG